MFSDKRVNRLLERTEEGAIRWQIVSSEEEQKQYRAEHNLIRFVIIAEPTGPSSGYGGKRYDLTLIAMTAEGSILVNDFGEWNERGPSAEGGNALYKLIRLIEEQEKERPAEFIKKSDRITYILEKIK